MMCTSASCDVPRTTAFVFGGIPNGWWSVKTVSFWTSQSGRSATKDGRSDGAVKSVTRQITHKHCEVGTRRQLIREISDLKERPQMSVTEYADGFEQLVQFLELPPKLENEPLNAADLLNYFDCGMPLSWQAAVQQQTDQWSCIE